jgi:hypothetical protein
VELTGFEPVTPSLRKMRSDPSDQGKRPLLVGLWGGCGPSDVRHGETWQRDAISLRSVQLDQGQATPSAFAAVLSFMTRRRSFPGTAWKSWCW